jgi:hypothetical protein
MDMASLLNSNLTTTEPASAPKTEKQISHIIDDDIVVTKEVPIEENKQSDDAQKSKKNASKRRQRKNKGKKNVETAQPAEVDPAPAEADGMVNEITKLMDKNKISATGLSEDVMKSAATQIKTVKAAEAIADAIINKKGANDAPPDTARVVEVDPVNILGLLVHHDSEMRKTEHQQAEVFKKMLFPNDDFLSDSSRSETGSQKLINSCEKIKS